MRRARMALSGAALVATAVAAASANVYQCSDAHPSLEALHPHAFFYAAADALANEKAGSTRSCSLYAMYMYVLVRNDWRFDPKEFAAFRTWATRAGVFFPQPGAKGVVDLEGLARRLPEFFGSAAASLDYRLPLPASGWSAGAADAIAEGRSVLALLSSGSGTVREADHIVTLVSTHRSTAGVPVGFFIHDPDSYKFWETTHYVTVAELDARLARPAVSTAPVVTVLVSTEVAFARHTK